MRIRRFQSGSGRRGNGGSRIMLAAALALGSMVPAAAADDIRLAVVAPVAGSSFFDAVQAGCAARAAELSANRPTITCLYGGPGFALAPPAPDPTKVAANPAPDPSKPDAPAPAADQAPTADKRSEAQIILDFAAAHVDGIAVSPTNEPAVSAAIQTAVKAGIPVITFDSDAPASGRAAFIGTNAREFGRALGASLRRWKPKGGKYAIVTTDPAQPNMAERIYGVRDAIGPGWAEITDSPVITSGGYPDAVAKIDHLLNSYYDVDAIISVGAWPMLATAEWRDMIGRYKARIDKADVVLVVADALPAQKDFVRQGLGHVLVGQKPADMGARAADLLLALKSGRKVPEVVYVGFETFTRLDLVGAQN